MPTIKKSSPAVQLEAAAFVLAAGSLSLEELGALLLIVALCASHPDGLPCDASGMPNTRLVNGMNLPKHWPAIRSYFEQTLDGRVVPGPSCPCRIRVAKTRTATATAKKPKEWTGTLPRPLQHLSGLWEQWLQYRREEKREPVTQRAGNMQVSELLEMGPKRAERAIRTSIAKGWRGIFEPAARASVPANAVRHAPICGRCGRSDCTPGSCHTPPSSRPVIGDDLSMPTTWGI